MDQDKLLSRLAGALIRTDDPVSESNKILARVLAQPEVVEIILSNLDMERLKICRLVCRDWNEEICRMLRKEAASYIKGGKEQLELDQVIQVGKAMELPSPFSGLLAHLQTHQIGDDGQLGFSLSPRLQPLGLTKVSLVVPEALGFSESVASSVFELLKRSGRTLSHLKTPCWGPLPAGLKEDLKLPKLKALAITRTTNPYYKRSEEETLDFFVTITALAPNLTALDVMEPTVSACMDRGSLRKIQTLTVTLETRDLLQGFKGDHGLSHVKIDGLRSLALFVLPLNDDPLTFLLQNMGEQASSWISTIIARFSGTIQRLRLYYNGFKLSQGAFPPLCPVLEELELTHYLGLTGGLDGAWTLAKLPALKTVRILDFDPTWSLELGGQGGKDWSPSLSVHSVHVERSIFHSLWDDLSPLFRQFPNATSWTFDYPMVVGFFRMFSYLFSGNPVGPVPSVERLAVVVNAKVWESTRGAHREYFLRLFYEQLPKLERLRELQLLTPPAVLDLTKLPIQDLPELKTLAFNCVDPKMLVPVVTSQAWKKLQSIVILKPLDSKHALTMEGLFCKCPALKYGFKPSDFPPENPQQGV